MKKAVNFREFEGNIGRGGWLFRDRTSLHETGSAAFVPVPDVVGYAV